MSLAEMQSFLARLYVDSAFLKLFSLNRGYALEDYTLSDEERSVVSQLDPKAVKEFADSLKLKRKKRFQNTFPLSFKLGGPDADRHYDRFCQLYRFQPNEAFLHQAIALGQFLESATAMDSNMPLLKSNVARYERLHFCAQAAAKRHLAAYDGATPSDGTPHELVGVDLLERRPRLREGVYIASFPVRLGVLLQSIEQEEEISISRNAIFYCVFCPMPDHRTKIFEVTEGSYAFLSLLDGASTLGQIVHTLQGKFRQENLEGAIVGNAIKLSQLGPVEL